MTKPWRLAYLVSHPIQYQAPLLRLISAEPDIDLTVFFCSDLSVRDYHDEGFGHAVRWDVPLLEGYRHHFLPAFGRTDRLSFWRPLNRGLTPLLRDGAFDAIWVHGWGYWSHLWAIASARRLGIKVFMRGESGVHLEAPTGAGGLLRSMVMRYLATSVDAFLAIGSHNKSYYLSNGIDPGRVFMMPYAVDTAFFREKAVMASRKREQLMRELRLQPGRPVILFASKMIERKRPFDVLEAFLQFAEKFGDVSGPYLLFIGDGELRAKLEERANRQGGDAVRFLGFKNQTELPAYFDLCDVFVLPSMQEPWGLVVNEAMSAERAVIVSDEVGCAPDLVRNGENGFVYPAGDVAALRDRLRDVLADPGRARHMGEKSLGIIDSWGFRQDIAGLKEALAVTCPA